ncbi:MAG: tyrosine--tRNA ligase [Bacillota bacterium]|nr:tyrosine--tRNA ligase [Bacillota bacterium]
MSLQQHQSDDTFMRQAHNQLRIILKGAAQVVREDELMAKILHSLKTRKPLIIKLGLDPSAPDIHLGHAVVLRKVRQMQDLGHHAAIVIGDFTGRIGDPSGKSKTRRPLSAEQVLANAQTYEKQIFRIIDRSQTQVCFNSMWLAGLDFQEILQLAGQVTVARLLERDDFAGRYARQEPIGLHELFYPLMQAYDSVHLKADIELGGTDQTFNILMGRNIQKAYGQESQIGLFMPLLEGIDGNEKMSKSLGNSIGIMEEAKVQYEKIMRIPDHLIMRYYELATDMHPDAVDQIRQSLTMPQTNPRDIKMQLAETITRLYWDHAAANEAQQHFQAVFQEAPAEWLEAIACPSDCCNPDGSIDLPALLTLTGCAASKSEARRLINQNGLRIDGSTWTGLTCPAGRIGCVIQIGKRKKFRLSSS